MLKIKYIFILILLLASYGAYSQDGGDGSLFNFLFETAKEEAKSRLEGAVKDKIEEQLFGNDIEREFPNANPIEKYLVKTSLSSLLWGENKFSWNDIGNAFLNYAEIQNFEEEAKKLADFSYERGKLTEINQKYGMNNVTTAYSTMPIDLIETTKEIANQYTPIPFGKLGNGKVDLYISSMIAMSRNACLVEKLEAIYTPKAIEVIENQHPETATALLKAANDKKFAMLINLNPELYIDFFSKTMQSPNLCGNNVQTVYWTEVFGQKDSRLPDEISITQYQDLCFQNNDISVNGRSIATVYKNNCIYLLSSEMLSHRLIPQATLYYKQIRMSTDVLGRLSCVNTHLQKGKNKELPLFKKRKQFLSAINTASDKMVYFLIPKKYNGIDCLANVVVISKSKENKEKIKQINKSIKK